MADDEDPKPGLGTAVVGLNQVNTVAPQCDPRDPDFARWFDTGKDAQGIAMPPVRKGNEVIALVDGRETFDSMVAAIKTATGGAGSGHFIYLLAWILDVDFDVAPGTTMRSLLTKASSDGVEIRALLWDQAGTVNTKQVAFIDGLANGAAVLDNRTLNLGSHHQKILVVNGNQGLMTFCGGVDLNPDRINHVSKQPGSPMHDVHCRIRGPAAWDLLRVFVQRWKDHPDVTKKGSPKRDILGGGIPEPTADGTEGNCFVQVGRTFGNGKKHAGISGAGPGTQGYSFLNSGNSGEQTARQIIKKAIQAAQKFIYMEDQYLISMEASTLLRDQLPKIKELVILIPHSSISDLPGVWKRRKAFIDNLTSTAEKKKVTICYLNPKGQTPDKKKVDPASNHTYVHAKIYVMDDKFAIIGSANCNQRGWSHDSEVVAGIFDQSKDSPCTLHVAHKLRMKLWAEHLGLKEKDVFDAVGNAFLWALGTGKVVPYDQNADKDGVSLAPPSAVDPDGS